jgi:hypothetical protein
LAVNHYSQSRWLIEIVGGALAIAALVLEIVLRLRKHRFTPDRLTELRRKMAKKTTNPLLREAAENKYAEDLNFFEGLEKGQIILSSHAGVHRVINGLFADPNNNIATIGATSSGEITEWRSHDWWITSYLKLHQTATQNEKAIKRTFILGPNERLEDVADVLQAVTEAGTLVSTVTWRAVSPEDFKLASNCLVFFDRDGKALYALVAEHDFEGHLFEAIFYVNMEDVQRVAAAYQRISDAATILTPAVRQ